MMTAGWNSRTFHGNIFDQYVHGALKVIFVDSAQKENIFIKICEPGYVS